jgi:hypothetical protein
VDTPSAVNSGEKFTVSWQVTGPTGTTGKDTKLQLSLDTNKSEGNSSATASTNNSTSFGSFTVPKTFSAKYSFGGDPGHIHLTATAEVEGKTLTAAKTIELK